MMQNPSGADTPYLIVGLGNPGPKYATTRHNAGFMALDELARQNELRFSTRQANAEVARGEIAGTKVILAKPQTFMNLSGQAVRGLANYYRIPNQRILIIYDEIALPVGTIRIREKGSSAGHNGVTSVIQHMGTQNIARIRVGVDRPVDSRHSQIDWVLGRFNKEEQPIMEETIKRTVEAVEAILRIGMERAMNSYNTGPGEAKDEGRQAGGDNGETKPADTMPRADKNDLSMDTLRQRIERIMQRKEEGS